MKSRYLWALGSGLLSGLAMGLAYAPFRLWPLAPVAVAALAVLAAGQETKKPAAGIGFVFGLGLFGVTISYLGVLGVAIGVAVVVAMSLWTAGLAMLQQVAGILPAFPVWVASTWILAEAGWCRFPFDGFGWDRLGFTTIDQPLGGYLWVLSVSGVGWLVALVGGLLAWVYRRPEKLPVLACGALIGALTGGGVVTAGLGQEDVGETITVGIVQGNIDGSAGPHSMGYARSVTNNHLSQTITLLARQRSGLDEPTQTIIWPENSADLDPTRDGYTAWAVDTAATLAGQPIFFGAVMVGTGDDERQTSSLWWIPGEGIAARYDKQNAVPFGEFTPMKDLVFAVAPIAREVGRQTVEGTEPGALPVRVGERRVVLGPIICYELAFDDTVYQTVSHGAEVVIAQSNTASYTGTSQPIQQFDITRARAMELRREIVVATISSYSGLIAPSGQVLVFSHEGEAAATSLTVPLRHRITPAVRLGWWFETGAALLGLSVIGLARFRRTRIWRHG